jgi:hypothetical protein
MILSFRNEVDIVTSHTGLEEEHLALMWGKRAALLPRQVT